MCFRAFAHLVEQSKQEAAEPRTYFFGGDFAEPNFQFVQLVLKHMGEVAAQGRELLQKRLETIRLPNQKGRRLRRTGRSAKLGIGGSADPPQYIARPVQPQYDFLAVRAQLRNFQASRKEQDDVACRIAFKENGM